MASLPAWCREVVLITLREEVVRLMSLVHHIGEWVEDEARRNTLPVRRSTILEPLDRFDCNPIATQRHVIGRHSLIRAESPSLRMPA